MTVLLSFFVYLPVPRVFLFWCKHIYGYVYTRIKRNNATSETESGHLWQYFFAILIALLYDPFNYMYPFMWLLSPTTVSLSSQYLTLTWIQSSTHVLGDDLAVPEMKHQNASENSQHGQQQEDPGLHSTRERKERWLGFFYLVPFILFFSYLFFYLFYLSYLFILFLFFLTCSIHFFLIYFLIRLFISC